MAEALAQRLEYLMSKSSVRHHDGHELLGHLKSGRYLITTEPRLVKTRDGSVTLMHYACERGWLDFVKLLVEKHSCDPHAKARDGQTPLHSACTYGHLDIVRYLISELHSNPHTKTQSGMTSLYLACQYGHFDIVRYIFKGHGDPRLHKTPLYVACQYGRIEIVRYLISEQHCDPDCCDVSQQTPLHWLCGPKRRCTNEKALEIIKFLISNGKYDVNKRDKEGNTAFLLACRYECPDAVRCLITQGHCDVTLRYNYDETVLHVACHHNKTKFIATLLLMEAKINLNARNRAGRTPLHLACKSEKPALVELLVRDERCSVNEKDSDGDTALHVACGLYELDDVIAKLLLVKEKINPNMKNKHGDTPLHLACRKKNSVLVQLLIRHKRCNPNEQNGSGDSALHIACRLSDKKGAISITKLLLQETKIDVDANNSEGQTPLDVTSEPDLIRELIRHGANPRDVYKTHGKVLGKHSSMQPLQTPVKLFMVGNPTAGKSTLTKALQKEAFGLNRIKKRIVKVSGVDEKTAGIVPHEFESKIYGRVTLYDFAGQREFYGSHAALLQNAIQISTPIFLLVVDLTEHKEDIKQNIFYWLFFLENQCISVSSKPHFVIIGSHADILKSGGEDFKSKSSFILSILTTPQFSSLKFVGFVAMDCQYADSPGMTELHRILKTSCESLRIQENINFNAHCFLVYLLDKFRDVTALTLSTIQARIKEEFQRNETVTDNVESFVPSSIQSLSVICNQLNDRGHLLILKNSTTVKDSWVIINRTALLAEVNGTIFAPEGFKEHIKLASSTGVVPLSNIKKHFPNHDLNMLVGFLSHLEFCHEIADNEILELISYEQVSTAIEAVSVPQERYFFFPGLVTLEVPSTVWEPQPQFQYHSGWILQFSVLGQFFYPRFVQVLLLRLAFTFAFAQEAWCLDNDIPTLQRKCSVWKNGIYWGDANGIETLVEIAKQNRVVVLMRSPEVKSECLQLRSILIQKVLAAAQELCSKIETIELFINPSDTTQYPLKPTSELTLFSMKNVASVVAQGMQSPSVLDKTGTPIPLDTLLTFEPYAALGGPILLKLFADDNETQNQNADLYSVAERFPENYTDIFVMIFKPSPTQLRERMSEYSIASPVYHVLDIWRASCEGTYQCLRKKLDQFSVFAGRNPLDFAGISFDSHSQPTNGCAAVMLEVDSAMGCVLTPDHVDGLAASLDDLAGSWYRFAGLLGLSEGKRRQVQLNSAWKPDGAQLCLLDALHLWVKSDESATYEKITTVLQKHFPDRSLPLITAVREFAEQHALDY